LSGMCGCFTGLVFPGIVKDVSLSSLQEFQVHSSFFMDLELLNMRETCSFKMAGTI